MKCTCSPDQSGPVFVREKDCPDHGLDKMLRGENLGGMQLFKYEDGYQVLAGTREAADAMYAGHLKRQGN